MDGRKVEAAVEFSISTLKKNSVHECIAKNLKDIFNYRFHSKLSVKK